MHVLELNKRRYLGRCKLMVGCEGEFGGSEHHESRDYLFFQETMNQGICCIHKTPQLSPSSAFKYIILHISLNELIRPYVCCAYKLH